MVECEWFAKCHDPSTAVVEHPTLGDVEICAKHLDWLTEDLSPEGQPNPTKMVPPIAARSFGKLAARLTELDAEDDEVDA